MLEAGPKDGLKSELLTIIQEATKLDDDTYEGQNEPLSFHLARLERAIQEDDIGTISEYAAGSGSGNWFPYGDAVAVYLDEVELLAELMSQSGSFRAEASDSKIATGSILPELGGLRDELGLKFSDAAAIKSAE